MKNLKILNKKLLSAIILTAVLSTQGFAEQNILLGESNIEETSIDNVENPIEEYYKIDKKKKKSKDYNTYVADHYNARQPWNLREHNGRIYISTGNYNDGSIKSIPLLYYDEKEKKYVKDGSFNEQAIIRLNEIDDKLYIPGIDPNEDWELGNYYTIDNDNNFEKYRNIPNSPHTFDIVKHKGKLYCATSKYNEDSPVKVSNDDGKTWENVYVDEQGSNYDITRMYDLISFKGKLFALSYPSTVISLCYEYNEEENKFSYTDKVKFPIIRTSVNGTGYIEKAEIDGKLCILSGMGLYYTDDLSNWTQVEKTKNATIMDMSLIKAELYVLANDQVETEQNVVNTQDTDLNVRRYPYKKSESLERLKKGTSVQLTGNEYMEGQTKWIEVVTDNNVKGWVNSKYIKNKKTTEYKVILYKTSDLENFEEVLSFKYPSLARSFAYSTDSNEFLFGMGSMSQVDLNEHNGDIVRIGR